MKILISRIEEQAKDRPEGYLAEVRARGSVAGEWLEITSEAMAELRAIYRPAETTARAAKVIVRVKGSETAGELHQGTVKLKGCANCGTKPS